MRSYRRPFVALVAMLALVAVQAIADPTGLLALVGWSGALPRIDVPWTLAPYAVYLPVLLGVLWWAALRAGDRYWTLVPGVVLAILLAQAAAALVMTWDASAAAWASAYVTAKAVPAALIVAAFARWFGGPTDRARRAPGSVWLPAALFAAAAPLLAGLWWTSAVYAPGVPVARPDRGIASTMVAMVLLGLLTAVCGRWMRARVGGVLGGWLAAVVAGTALGVVQAVAAVIVDGLQSDLWPLMGAYVAVADGLSFGACVGWIAGVTAVLVDRITSRLGIRIFVAGTAAVAAVSLVVTGLAPAPGAGASTERTDDELPAAFLRADEGVISDGEGDQVLLRGVNVNQLVDFYRPRADVPATAPLTDEDFAGIAAEGFNVVRLGMSWSALEPERGTLDAGYVQQITDAVAQAKAHGLYVVLDMHQDSWWNEGTPEGVSCRPGTDAMWGYDGAPGWATLTDGAPRCQFQGRDISPASDRAFQNFYFDTDGVQGALVDTWAKLAAVFRDEPAVAGYDLLNEPGFGETAPVTTSHLLGRFYQRAIDAIRAEGAPQIVFIEPSILWSGLGFDSPPPAGFSDDANLVFSPHLYAESITMDRSLGLPPIVSMPRQFALAQRVADAYGMPLWSGEYGYWGDDADRVERLNRYADLEDAYRLGSAYWVWKQACGDPQGGILDVTDALMREDCATGEAAPPRDDLLQILGRAYPRSSPGTLTSLVADGARVELSGSGEGCGLEVWVPGASEPEVTVTGVSDIATEAVDGGWLVTGCAVQAAGADDDERETLQAEEQTQRHDERRDADPRDEEAYERADEEAEAEADQERERPGDALRGEHDEQCHADAAGDTGRQVDLAQEQHEHECHAEHDERGRLVEQVGEVALGEEERAEHREQDAEHDEAADGGQCAHVAAADPLPPGLDLVAEAALDAAADQVAGDGIGCGRRAGGVAAHSAPPSVRSVDVSMRSTPAGVLVPVMYPTTSSRVVSAVGICATIWPR